MKTFLYYLLDTPTGNAYYIDNTGTLKKSVMAAGSNIDVSLQDGPGNWLDTELSFIRNTTYYAINRSFTTPIQLVRNALKIVKELTLLGVGTEVPLTIAIFKYNSQPQTGDPQYKLYYKGNLDLAKISEQVLEIMSVNVMEGGVLQLLKSYENTILQIPCDGSLPENQKINLDGLLVNDTFYYQVIPLNDVYEVPFIHTVATPLPCSFINNIGDNYGIIHNDPNLDPIVYGGLDDPNQIKSYSVTSQNFIFMSTSPITVTVKGSLLVRYNNPTYFQVFLSTGKGRLLPITERLFNDNHNQVLFSFNQNITLDANETLFLFIQFDNHLSMSLHNMVDILDGSFSISFYSVAPGTRTWAIQALDLWKLIVKQICLLSSTTNQPLSYQATSNLLAQYSNFFFTSGDALRASGDATYQRYFSISETNQIIQTTFGPVIKISLRDFFQSLEIPLNCVLGDGFENGAETLYIETMASIYDSSKVDLDIGEVASLKWLFASDLMFSDFEIGYAPQSYDQVSGKYEYNTTLTMKAPVKSFQKKLSKISKIRWDSYGIERVRSNIGNATSTTRNDSDSSVFGLNADINNWIYDYFNAKYLSLVASPDVSPNTNLLLVQNVSSQVVNLGVTDGEYFQANSDSAIIVFNVPGFTASEACILAITGTLNTVNAPPNAPADTFTITLWHNGTPIFTRTTVVTGIDTDISFSYPFSEYFQFKDCLYITMSTTASGVASINAAQLNIGSYLVANASLIPVASGTAQKLLSWATFSPGSKPYSIGTSVCMYGYQYFVFNSQVQNTGFNLMLALEGYIWNQIGANCQIDIYINGQIQTPNTIVITSVNGSISPIAPSIFYAQLLNAIYRKFNFNDIIFITASVNGVNLNVEISNAILNLTSDYIKAYSLKRVQYDYISGIPNLAVDANGKPSTIVSGAPFNIEDLTPKTVYNKWKTYINSCFLDKVTGNMKFQTLSKNQYLTRTVGGVTITENSDEPIGGSRMFYPIDVEMKTNVPLGFAELMSASKNAHIHATFMGQDIYFFANNLTQKPALNESQTWKGILSPLTNLSTFVSITAFKIPNMAENSILCPFAQSIQFVPFNQVLDSKYHTYQRDNFLFAQQVSRWINQHNYYQPVQIGDNIPLQFITYGLSPVSYEIRKCDGTIYQTQINFNTVTSPAVSSPYALWQVIIPTATWPQGKYYINIYAGTNLSPALISEPINVLSEEQLEDTVLCEFKNSFNTQGMVFDSGFVGAMRFKGGYDNMFKQKYLGKFYVDQPQDIKVLNAIPYEVTSLLVGFDEGIPDYVAKKLIRQLLMDGTMLDGEGFSLDEGAEFEEVFTKGAPMKYQKINIRPTVNRTGISALSIGTTTDDSSMIVTINPQSFGPNITNSSGTTETDLIEVVVNP